MDLVPRAGRAVLPASTAATGGWTVAVVPSAIRDRPWPAAAGGAVVAED